MKRVLILCICFLFVVGCNKTYKDIEDTNKEDSFVLSKLDDNKDYIYYDDVASVTLSNGNIYSLKLININLNSEDASNVNLELNTLINQSYKKLKYNEDKVMEGTIIDYKVYRTDKYISVIVMSDYYMNNSLENDKYYVYVIDVSNGNVLGNDDILSLFDMSDNDLYDKLEKKIISDDVLFSLSNIKNNGYGLYINDESNLAILYNELNNDENIRKELVLD